MQRIKHRLHAYDTRRNSPLFMVIFPCNELPPTFSVEESGPLCFEG